MTRYWRAGPAFAPARIHSKCGQQHFTRSPVSSSLLRSDTSSRRVGTPMPTRCQAARRELLLATLLGPLVQETAPQRGSCPTCVGPVDGTLGSCAGLRVCLSSYDDRPGYFLNPWQYEMPSQEAAVRQLVAVLDAAGATIVAQEAQPAPYVYVTWPQAGLGSTTDAEFMFAPNDNTVAVRSVPRAQGLPDLGRNEARLEGIRRRLGWEQVPVLRNRTRALLFVESPWDTFGPAPPAGMESNQYSDGDLDFDG